MELKEIIERGKQEIAENDSHMQLTFCKKMSKLYKNAYKFVQTSITEEISKQLSGWLVSNLEQLESDMGEADYNPDLLEVDLKDVNHWEEFENSLNPSPIGQDTNIEKLKPNLRAFLTHFTVGKKSVGYVRRMFPKNVLEKGVYRLLFDNSTFSRLTQQQMIEIDQNSDFIFVIDPENGTSKGFEMSQDNFDFIFDMYEKYAVAAKDNFSKLSSMFNSDQGQKLLSLVEENKTVQRRLTTNFVQKGILELTIDDVKKQMETVSPKTQLYLKAGENGILHYEEGKEKEALSQFLDFVGYKFSKTLAKDHLMKGEPEKFL